MQVEIAFAAAGEKRREGLVRTEPRIRIISICVGRGFSATDGRGSVV